MTEKCCSCCPKCLVELTGEVKGHGCKADDCTCHIKKQDHSPEKGGWEERFIEEGAAFEHERWGKWQAYLHSKCIEHENGKGEWVCFPSELFKRWERQIQTEYSKLSESERDSDRREVESYLPLVRELIASERAEAEQRGRSEERTEITEAMKTLATSFSMQHVTPSMEMTATKLLGAYHEENKSKYIRHLEEELIEARTHKGTKEDNH